MQDATSPALQIHLCEPWCTDHYDGGGRDQWCHAAPQVVALALAESDTDGTVAVAVDAHEDLGATVLLLLANPCSVRHLLAHEARLIARRLLAAADLADGVTATW